MKINCYRKEIKNTYVFRKIDNKEDLEEYFRLRYLIYNQKGYIPEENNSKLEINEYDAYSVHFGGFLQKTNGGEEIVSTQRIVLPKKQKNYKSMIEKILEEKNDPLLNHSLNKPPFQFPSMKSFPELKELIKEYEDKKIMVSEYGRTITHTNSQRLGLSKMINYLAICYSLMIGNEVAFGSCNPKHIEMYQNYGWKITFKGKLRIMEDVNYQEAVNLKANIREDISPSIINTVTKEFKKKFGEDKHICVCPISNWLKGKCEYDKSKKCFLQG